MTAVLLVADTDRVQRVFADLESKGVLRLHAAATLAQVDQVLVAATPAFIFVQSRISGLSTSILLRHLKKTVPDTAKIVLLSADAADVPSKRAPATLLVDLRLPDDVVAETVAGIVSGALPSAPAKGQKSAADKGKKAPRSEKDDQRRKGGSPPPRPAAATVAASPAPCPPPARGGATKREAEGDLAATAPLPDESASAGEAPAAPSARNEPALAGDASAAASAPALLPAGEPEAAEEAPRPVSFLEMMEAASSKSGHEIALNVEERVSIDSPAESSGPAEAEPPPQAAYPPPGQDRVKEETFASGKRKRAMWPFVLLLSFLLLPSGAYLVGRIARTPEKEARQHADKAAGRQPSQFAAPAPAAALPPSKAAGDTSLAASWKPDTPQLSGLAALPPFLEGVEADRGYSVRHPGWERYLGAKAEYKIFREGGRYRAIQAIARAGEIPDELFKRVLLEFGGIAGYAVKSTETKGKFLVEQATGSGSASLTIYRKRGDQRVKGVVVYYH